MTHWNYRVIKRVDGDETSWAIHECYYDKRDDVIPSKWTVNPATIGASRIRDLEEVTWAAASGASDEIREVIRKMLTALEKPVLLETDGKLIEDSGI